MNRKAITQIMRLILAVAVVVTVAAVVQAAGNIDAANKWAWGANVGWLNFNDTNGGVTVFNDHLEGYVWGENIGWVRLGKWDDGSPHTYANDAANTYGVNNDGSGNLSGYAWGTNVGWINFNPTHGGVTIDPTTGSFDGYAWGENVGWIHFKNTSGNAYNVVTTFYPATAPEIDVTGQGVSIADGDAIPATADDTDFGNVTVGGAPVTHTFTISNTDAADLTLSGVSLTSASHFTVTQPVSSTVGGGQVTIFAVAFKPTAAGSFTDTVSIANNDSDENPYTFVVGGAGQPPATATPTSTPTATGTATPTPTPTATDVDTDGVENSIEDGVSSPGGSGGNGGGNGDGIPDRDQSDVASLPNAVDGGYVTLASSGEIGLHAVKTISPTAATPAGVALPQGLFTFQVSGLAAGSAYSATLILHTGAPPTEYWKYGPTPDDPTDHWYEFAYDSETGAVIVGNRVTLHFVDGKRGDSDLSANGVIVDPGGPAQRTTRFFWFPLLYRSSRLVYANDFSQDAGGNWLQQSIGAAPNGQRFLGEFGNETVKLTLTDLPAHSQATVAFDLYVIRSWDGNQTVWPAAAAAYAGMPPDAISGPVGPDRWMLQANAQTLLDTTFANIPEFRQAYPDNFPGGDHPAQTGAAQTGAAGVNGLRYLFADRPMDAVYHIERTFAHSGGSLTLDFAALGLQIISDESWGLDNVSVTVQ